MVSLVGTWYFKRLFGTWYFKIVFLVSAPRRIPQTVELVFKCLFSCNLHLFVVFWISCCWFFLLIRMLQFVAVKLNLFVLFDSTTNGLTSSFSRYLGFRVSCTLFSTFKSMSLNTVRVISIFPNDFLSRQESALVHSEEKCFVMLRRRWD